MIRRCFMLATLLLGSAQAADTGSATDVARAALEQALRAAHPDAVRMEVTPVGKPVATPGGATWIATVPDVRAVPRRVTVAVNPAPGTQNAKAAAIVFSVSLVRPVLCAVRALRPGAELVSADLVLREREVAGARAPLAAVADTTGMRVRHFIPEGTGLSAADLAPAPAVVKGREVSVLVATPSVQIEARGIADQDGERGHTIRVRSKNSDATYMAEVIEQGRVRVAGR